MPAALIATKLHIPRVRAERVARPALLDRLNAGLAGRLTLVSAPAGFGKTTLVAEWVSHLDRPVAWLSLDERDSDPARFLAYFISALQHIEDEAGTAALASIGNTPAPSDIAHLLPQLVNDIQDIPEPFVLVLDDYHLVTGQPVHDALAFVIEHQPEPMHLVITTRADPPLPLARLRARGQLNEIRQADLRFTPAEATELLRANLGSKLASDQVETLTERTEGWIAALQMASLALRGLPAGAGRLPAGAETFVRTFGGAHRHIADYLVEEVLAQQPEEVRSFLLRTSILDRLTGPLCDDLLAGESQSASGTQMLEDLERANLFIEPLDDRRQWYRYHRLFSDLLRLRLSQSDPPIDAPSLHRRASAWYAAHDMLPEAIQHASQAADDEQTAMLIEQAAPAAWRQGELTTALQWLDSLSQASRRRHPLLSVYLATICLLRAEPFARVEALVQEAAASDSQARCAGEVALLRSMVAMYRGEVPAALAESQQAVVRIPDDSPFRGLATRVRSALHLMTGDLDAAERLLEQDVAASDRAGDRLGCSASLRRLGSLALMRGGLRRAGAFYQRALDLSRDSAGRPWPVAGRILLHLAEIALERNDLNTAEALVNQGSDLLERFLPGWNSEAFFLRARLEHARGREDGARASSQMALERARTTETSMDDVFLEIQAARLAIWQGDLAAAERWASKWTSRSEPRSLSRSQDLEVMIRSRLFREMGRTTLVRYHLARGDADEARKLLGPSSETDAGPSPWGNRVELLALHALAKHAGGDSVQAQRDLDEALGLAEPEGFVRAFIEEGEPMKRLLQEAARRDRHRAYALRLLQVMEAGTRPPPAPEHGSAPAPLVEPLTEREVEVLRLLQTSLTTPEIADELGIAPSTVRTFVKNVYGKLGVHRRLDALDRGRELGLLNG
jgi:LuxR family maltose regulon positive regulatory protein